MTIVETLYLAYLQRTKQSTPLSGSIQNLGVCCCFANGTLNCSTTLHMGNMGGKALFSPFEVGKMPGRLFRTKKCLNYFCRQLKIVIFSLVHVFILSFHLELCDYKYWILLFPGKKHMLIKSVTNKHHPK